MDIQKIRVPAGFAFAAVYLFFSRPTPVTFNSGILIAAFGLVIRIWATGHLEKWRRLATGGPYRFTRNPLYLGSFLMGVGFMVASAKPLLLLLFLIFFALIYFPVMRREEGELRTSYGDSFDVYREEVPLFMPAFQGVRKADRGPVGVQPGNFRWRRVILNREYNAVIGFAVLTLVLYLKMIW